MMSTSTPATSSSMRHLSLSLCSSASISSRSSIRQQRLLSTSSKSSNQNQDSPTAAQDPSSSSSNLTSSQKQSSSSSSPKPLSRTTPLQFNSQDLSTFPSLIHRTSPLYDSGKVFHSPTSSSLPYPSSYTLINESDSRLFKQSPPSSESLIASSGGSTSGGTSGNDQEGAEYLSSVTNFSVKEINDLHRHAIVVKRVIRMSGKGKMSRMSALVVVGDGKGMVGFGEAKDPNAGKAGRKAFQQGVKNMDYVKRYENRTVETEIEGKWSATRVILRPRPAGE